MHRPMRISTILRIGGFAFHSYVGRRFKVRFLTQCYLIAAFSALSVFVASLADHSLILSGRNVGLLQHPTIWSFIGLQIALPISIANSLKKLLKSRINIHSLIKTDHKFSESLLRPVLSFIHLETAGSKSIAALIYSVGLAAFVWNTYQNQHPGQVVPYDFWDSKTYFWGFWVTRIYKFYLFVLLLPYIALVHIAILTVTLRFIRKSRIHGNLKIIPFHADGVGGLGFIPGLITTPVIVATLISSIPTAAAFEIHRRADVTPLIGLWLLILSSGIAYIVPILFLRSDIIASKQEIIGKLRSLEQNYYARIIDGQNLDFDTLKRGSEALDYFDKVCSKIQSISNYPHLKHLIRYLGLALTPSVITVALKLYEDFLPIFHPASKKP